MSQLSAWWVVLMNDNLRCGKEGELAELRTWSKVHGDELKSLKKWIRRLEGKIDELLRKKFAANLPPSGLSRHTRDVPLGSNNPTSEKDDPRVRAALILGVCSVLAATVSSAFLYFTYR